MLRHQQSKMHSQSMDLDEFLKGLPRGGQATFAERLGISRVYLQQLAVRQDGRVPSPELCVLIERESFSRVRRWNTRPKDWHRIWPELIGIADAPAVPEAANDDGKQVA
jgi:DNA-binding transcriptional regulator YdaS (Cro superfamily)